ncbi:E3 ubiquitin-protein ligase RMA1H1 [Melia azedarach]|uniref:E3 ubiquitin-protein ligase RMA1H1 n=1 Tax=Melia azedarach TaxID=155640 RepID=A0ACC1YSG6_MELAZ|nr:E3 ubiquitin-protein ligase RMA1H1 [Melia azedarach]
MAAEAYSSVSESEKPNLGMVIPRRPRPSMLNSSVTSGTTSARHSTQRSHTDYFQSQTESFHYPSHTPIAFSSLGGMATISFFNPLIGLFGGMALGRIFGGSAMSLFTYPSTNPLFVSNNPRIRRQEMEVERCLNRVSFFLFCCLVLCLLLF